MSAPRIEILLVAVNARYSHCAFAARTLIANLGTTAARADLLECDLEITPFQLAQRIMACNPQIVGFSIYLWNVRVVESTARILRIVAPQVKIVAGGPELTVDYSQAALFDAVIVGEGESAFRAFCQATLRAPHNYTPARTPVLTHAPDEDLDLITLPYALYSETDLAQRTIYVEASRGCPYACGYCTSAGTGLRLIPCERLLPALDTLWQRGVRRYKFLDRSFNAPVIHACEILDFFRRRVTPDTCLHFEIQPDFLHTDIAQRLADFPANTLHLEVGVQTLNSQVAAAIGRCPDTVQTLETLRFLVVQTKATVHADLIFGLPGEDEHSFAQGFNQLVATCTPPQVQVNLLKGLPGTRFVREAQTLGLAFNPEPPYELLHSDAMDFGTLTRVQNFARCWELVYNRGHFPAECQRLKSLAGHDLYATYQRLTDHISTAEGKLFAIARHRLATLLQDFLCTV